MRPFDRLHDDIRSYLDSLTPDLPVHTKEEIAVFCVNLFIIREGDVIKEVEKEYKSMLIRNERRNIYGGI